MKNLASDIKNGTLKKVYLLYGDEAYLKKMYKNKIQIILPHNPNKYKIEVLKKLWITYE